MAKPGKRCNSIGTLAVVLWVLASTSAQAAPKPPPSADVPRSRDPRLLVECFAAAPDIVHPIGIDFDHKGRLLVIESHTHFRPGNYQGPKRDRIRILEDSDGDGKADKFTTFFEGTTATMDIAVHPDGSVYLATRNEILRLRDSNPPLPPLGKGGKGGVGERIVFLDTAGDYPHNGLSGLAFDEKGNLYFGMGENLGARYRLLGSDGTVIADEGEGGNIFWCTADGKKLRRVATGFWNPFGVCRDIYGRIFAVDNDPDAAPPCRLLHVVEGADFGYQFRYGRSGRHPFQSWYGQLPGTLPMVAGTGEGPCEVISYESDGLPREYVGDLLVASWADHRIERYVLKEQGASFTAERKPFIQGGKDFRPVGIAVAPDGSLFVSDWVLSDYNLHNRGAIWHIRMKEPPPLDRPSDPRRALLSAHRPLREAAARQLLAGQGRAFLRQQITHPDARVRATALTALIDAAEPALDLNGVADKDSQMGIRAMAVHSLAAKEEDVSRFLEARHSSAVRMEAVAALKDRQRLLGLLADKDPYLRHAAVHRLAQLPELLDKIDSKSLADSQQRLGVLLAQRRSGRPEGVRLVSAFLADADEEVRFLAAKWIADHQLAAHRPLLVDRLKDPKLSARMYLAYLCALGRIDKQDVSEMKMADRFVSVLTEPASSSELRIMALRQLQPPHWRLTVGEPDKLVAKGAAQHGYKLAALDKLLPAQNDPAVRREMVRLLNEHPSPQRIKLLLEVARNPREADLIRAEALVGLAEQATEVLDDLLAFAGGDNPTLRDEALRGLVQTSLTGAQRAALAQVPQKQPRAAELVARVLGQPFSKERPRPEDTAAWLQRLDGPADADAGRRVFFHPKLASCCRCHRCDGRGADIGPDLGTIGRTERRHILESILQPSNLVAPHYQTWLITTADGRTHTGMLVRTYLDEYTYVDAQGKLFKLSTPNVVESQALPQSIMPNGLAELLTDRELRDLLAYLGSRR